VSTSPARSVLIDLSVDHVFAPRHYTVDQTQVGKGNVSITLAFRKLTLDVYA
jgi:hypothetical protein